MPEDVASLCADELLQWWHKAPLAVGLPLRASVLVIDHEDESLQEVQACIAPRIDRLSVSRTLWVGDLVRSFQPNLVLLRATGWGRSETVVRYSILLYLRAIGNVALRTYRDASQLQCLRTPHFREVVV